MLEEHVLEEIDSELNYDYDIRMAGSREEHCMDIDEGGQDMINIHVLRWDFYTKDKQELIKRGFWVAIPYPKGGGVDWTCVKYYITKEIQDYEDIGIRGFAYKLFE